MASPRFQRAAVAFPLTRGIANRRARTLFDICAGFVYTQILLACVRLDVFEHVREQPRTSSDLAERLDLPKAATARLLAGAVSLRLLERRSGERFGLGALGAAMVGNRGIAAMVEHHALLYADLEDPVALLRRGGGDTALARYWAYAGAQEPSPLPADRFSGYSALMGASQAMIAEDVVAAYAFRRHRCLLDVGGGDGTFATAVAERRPDLRIILFDLPHVAELARAALARRGLDSRINAVGGDFFADRLPLGADVVTLVRILHDHDDDAVLSLLRAVHRALPESGVVVVAEPMSDTPGAEPIGDAYFGIYLFAMGQGRPRSPNELISLLSQAGFTDARLHPTRRPFLTRVISARRGRE